MTTLDEALAAANRIGYPVMVKASEGGGGKGIRMSHSDEDMRSHFVQVSFGSVRFGWFRFWFSFVSLVVLPDLSID